MSEKKNKLVRLTQDQTKKLVYLTEKKAANASALVGALIEEAYEYAVSHEPQPAIRPHSIAKAFSKLN